MVNFPNPSGVGQVNWNGQAFDGIISGVLEYPMPGNPQGWNDDLTFCHDETGYEDHPINYSSIQNSFDCCHQYLKGIKNASILEIGCSSGFLVRKLKKELPDFTVIGADIVDVPLRRLATLLKDEGIPAPLLRFDLTDCPLPDAEYDAIIALNVLEHIKEDEKALAQIFRLLKPKGVFIFEVPAGSTLYDDYDRWLCHYRRYEAKQFSVLLEKKGFVRHRLSHLGFFVYPAFWALKKWRSNQKPRPTPKRESDQNDSTSERKLISASNNILTKLLFKLELKLGKKISWPFGIRCFGAYIKPE
ncbi:MAG: class I SAM-dependent methyltransferase [Deltaproteobacteria bacterium]|jgi:SAM-dependent methyltransferase|nr:class I SAM-dependent methyltransferase [Deltaproteobacteria bacterium]